MVEDSSYGNPDVYYEQIYEDVICTNGIGAKVLRLTHSAMEKPYRNRHFSRVLDVGGGSGEHFQFVLHAFDEYVLLDTREVHLPEALRNDSRVTSITGDAECAPFPDSSFDRVIVTCVLHHVSNPERMLSEIDRLLRMDGVATIYIACDPGMLWRFVRYFTVRRQAHARGFRGFDLMISREHRNHVGGLVEMVKFAFHHRELRLEWRPFRLRTWNFNGYVIARVGPRKSEMVD